MPQSKEDLLKKRRAAHKRRFEKRLAQRVRMVEGREYRYCEECKHWKDATMFPKRGTGRQRRCWSCGVDKKSWESVEERSERAEHNKKERERYTKRTEAGLTEHGKKVRATIQGRRRTAEARLAMEKLEKDKWKK